MTARTSALVLALTLCACASACRRARPSPGGPASELDRVVRAVCDREVVLLGESALHDDGATVTARAALIERLVDECGFAAVLVEVGLYDFVSLERALAAGRAERQQLVDAISPMWSTAREAGPWIDSMFRRLTAGTLRVGGIDVQIGRTSYFAQRSLSGELTSSLAPPRRADCEAELLQYAQWQYTEAEPFEARVGALRDCISEIGRSLAAQPPAADDARATMARSFAQGVELNAASAGLDGDNLRDRAMFDNLQWHRSRLPAGAKVIVWCASVHAAKGPIRPGWIPMGMLVHDALGDRAAAIAFSAHGGSHGRSGRPATELMVAPDTSVEGRAFLAGDGDLRFVDRDALAGLGHVTARPLDYQFEDREWAPLFDGIVVLRTQHPHHAVAEP